MTEYHWLAADAAGRLHRGRQTAARPAALAQQLQAAGLTLIRSRIARPPLLRRGKVNHREQLLFTLQLEQLLRTGVPLLDALQTLAATGSPALRDLLARLYEDIGSGSRFSAALARQPQVFDASYVGLVHAGEESGRLPEVLASLGDALKWRDGLRSEIRRLVAYPAFVAVLVTAVSGFLLIHLVPQLADFLQMAGQTMPASTRWLLALSSWLAHYGPYVLAGTVVALLGTAALQRRSAGFARWLDRQWLRIPLLGKIILQLALARFAQTLALLYGAGLPLLQALAITQGAVGNRAVAASVEEAASALQGGAGLAAAFTRTRLFPPLLLRMLHLGEQTGELDTALSSVAEFYVRDVRAAVNSLQRLIEPCLTVMLGALLAWVMHALLGPIFDTLGALR